MKKQILLLVTIVLFFGLYSCSKDDSDLSSGKNYLEISVDGKKYDADNGGIMGYSWETCDEKPGYINMVGAIETSEFYFEFGVTHYENLSDFESQIKGEYGVKKLSIIYSGGNLCKFDAAVWFDDKIQSDHDIRLAKNGKNTITNIKRLDETSSNVNYEIQGNFSCTFVNNNGEGIEVTGKYSLVTYVLK